MSKNQRLQVELALLKMCHLSSAIQLARQGTDVGQQPVKKKPESSVALAAAATVLPATTAGQPSSQVQPEKIAVPLTSAVKSPVPVADAVKAQPPALDIAPEKTAGGWRSVSISTSVPNLETIFDDREAASDAEPDYIRGTASEPFTIDELLRYWHQFADQAKAAGKISLFTLMTAHVPKLTPEHQIEVIVENAIQENLLTESKIDMLNFLRQRLRNFSVGLIPVAIAQDVKRKPYTNQEKYQAMAAKNPLLDKFRQEFNLGFE